MERLSDGELKNKTNEFRNRLKVEKPWMIY